MRYRRGVDVEETEARRRGGAAIWREIAKIGRASGLLWMTGMAKSFREMECWQLGFELSRQVHALLEYPAAARNFKFRDQLSDAVRGPCRNIAEGFGRFNPSETLQFLDFATSALDETETHLREGVASNYFPAEKVAPSIVLIARCRKAIESWQSYLRSVKDDPKFNQSRRRNGRRKPPSKLSTEPPTKPSSKPPAEPPSEPPAEPPEPPSEPPSEPS